MKSDALEKNNALKILSDQQASLSYLKPPLICMNTTAEDSLDHT